ncbi:MAG: hypothetical protein UR60_C0049G0008, partial [Candidatus Moranbacteria bacterium GW2011_GWF2_34_56]
MKSSKKEVLEKIATQKELNDEIVADLNKAIEEYKNTI